MFSLRIHSINESQRDLIIEKITEKGVSVNVHFVPMPMLTAFKDIGYNIENFPVSYDNYAREISLPIYPQLTNEQVDFICNVVLKSYHEVVSND